MNARRPAASPQDGTRKWSLRRFAQDREGASFIEFAFISPLIVLLIVGGLTIYDAMLAYRRTQDMAAAVGSTLARLKEVHNEDLVGSLILSTAYMFPFSPKNYTIVIAAFTIDSAGVPQLQWCERWSLDPGGDCSGTPTLAGWNWETGPLNNLAIPANLRIPNSGLLIARVEQDWKSPVGSFMTNGMKMKETMYYVPQSSYDLSPPPRINDGSIEITGTLRDYYIR